MILNKSTSLADQVFEQLENDILSGRIPKGTVLTEIALANELGVSRTPVREALSKLMAERMLEEKGKGAIVIGISDEDMLTIYEIRERIEGLAASKAAKNINPQQLAKIKEILDLQEFYISKDDTEKIREQDNAFHEMLYKACGSNVLCDSLISLHKKVQKYRRLSVSSNDRAKESLKEHMEIYKALAKRDAGAAEKMAIFHVQAAKRSIEKKLIKKA